MEASQHVRDWPDREPGPSHGLVPDDDSLQKVQTGGVNVLGHRQGGGDHNRARMTDGLLVHIVQFEGMG